MKTSINTLKLDPLKKKDQEALAVNNYIVKAIIEAGGLEVGLSLRTISDDLKMSFAKVQRIVNRLEQMEVLEVVRGKGKGSNIYRCKTS